MSTDLAVISPPQPTRAEISRANGRKGRGPVTPLGKSISARNALKHGLRAEHIAVLPLEDPREWEAHMEATLAAVDPQNYLEALLAERVAVNAWKLRRVTRAHASIAAVQLEAAPEDAAQTCAEKEMGALVAVLGRRRGGISVPDTQTNLERETQKLSARRLIVEDIEQAELLDRYEGTAERGFYKALARLQAMRTATTSNSGV